MTPAELLEASQWDTFWVPPDAEVTDRPELLVIRCPRPQAYLNVVLRARGDPAERLADVRALPSRHPVRWMVTDTVDPAATRATLGASGWAEGPDHEVRTLPVASWTRRPAVEVHAVDSEARLRDCIAVAAAAFGGWSAPTPEQLRLELEGCTVGGRVHRFVAYVDGRPAASGGLTAFGRLGFGLLWAGATHPDLRGRGAYSAVLGARIERARELGLARVGLYALGTTSAPIVTRMGFDLGGHMQFWTAGARGH